MTDKSKANRSLILQPHEDVSPSLQANLDALYKKHQGMIKQIDTVFNQRIIQLEGSDDFLVQIELYRNIVTDYAKQLSEEAARYYAASRELWATASDIELEDYKEFIVQADQGLYDTLHWSSHTNFDDLTWKQVYTGCDCARLTIEDMWEQAVAHFNHNDSLQ